MPPQKVRANRSAKPLWRNIDMNNVPRWNDFGHHALNVGDARQQLVKGLIERPIIELDADVIARAVGQWQRSRGVLLVTTDDLRDILGAWSYLSEEERLHRIVLLQDHTDVKEVTGGGAIHFLDGRYRGGLTTWQLRCPGSSGRWHPEGHQTLLWPLDDPARFICPELLPVERRTLVPARWLIWVERDQDSKT
jgi:hypothetical protein